MVWTSLWSTGSPGTTEMDMATKTGGVTVDVPASGTLGFALDPVRPNPMQRGALNVHFTLASDTPAQVELLDVSGRRLASREVGSLGAGRHAVELGDGRHLPAGLYLVSLRQDPVSRVERVIVIE